MNAPMVIQHHPIEEMERMAGAVARSGLFGIKTPDQALALMLIAHAEGRHPALAARDYDIIQGRPSKKAEAMQRDFLSAGGKIEWHQLDDTIADATFTHPQSGSIRISWDIARATKAGLGGKEMWQKWPRQMLRSRTISEGVRTAYPAATSGMMVPEEVSEIPPERDVTPTDPAPPAITALPEYPADKFAENLPKWRALIDAEKQTPDRIIAKVETTNSLTDAQIRQIKGESDAPA